MIKAIKEQSFFGQEAHQSIQEGVSADTKMAKGVKCGVEH